MKCLVKGCTEYDVIEAGEWLCPKCFVMIVTGFVGEGHTFIHDLRDRANSPSVVSTLANGIDGEHQV